MEIYWYDIVGNIGVFLILLAYGLLQTGKIQSAAVGYSILNAAGAGFVLVSFIGAFNLAAFVLEAFWLVISLWGIYVALVRKDAAQT